MPARSIPTEASIIESVLISLHDAFDDAVPELSDRLRNAREAARELPEDCPFDMDEEITQLLDRAHALSRRIERVHDRLQRWAEPPQHDASTIADVRYHERREAGEM